MKRKYDSRIMARVLAHCYVTEVARQLNWVTPINSDNRLAETLDIPVNDITSLRNGLSDPSEQLVIKFRELVSPMIPEDDIKDHLVKPFLQSTE